MSKAVEYYARAAQCKIRAAETTDPEFHREFERLAEKWNDLAIEEELDGNSLLNTANQFSTAAGNEGGVRVTRTRERPARAGTM